MEDLMNSKNVLNIIYTNPGSNAYNDIGKIISAEINEVLKNANR